jgi:hypothetical protein
MRIVNDEVEFHKKINFFSSQKNSIYFVKNHFKQLRVNKYLHLIYYKSYLILP